MAQHLHHQVQLRTATSSDGSATYKANGCTVIASVNGPVEVTRRDELPEAATIDVAVRPAAGIGGIRERHFESILHRTLSQVIRVADLPRTLIQITLQITTGINQDTTAGRSHQADSLLYFLPVLLNAATLGLLTTAVPLDTTPIATVVAIARNGSFTLTPSWPQIREAASIHAFAFSTSGKLLMVESEGSFDLSVWETAVEAAKRACLGVQLPEAGSAIISSGHEATLETLFRNAITGKA